MTIDVQNLQKLIVTQEDLDQFLKSDHFNLFWNGFVLKLNEECTKDNISCNQSLEQLDSAPQSENIRKLLNLIEKCEQSLKLFPRGSSQISSVNPTSSAHRFGHVEFRSYYDYLWDNVPKWIQDAQWSLSDVPSSNYVLGHILPYFLNSFGNSQRIDYGTGHELNFLVFLYSLYKCKFLPMHSSLAYSVLNRYIQWMRQIQLEYWLEPAGSHGVWGLDDYQFLPFLFGSAQLVGHQFLRPKNICESEIAEEYGSMKKKNCWMFFECVRFIYKVKFSGQGSLAWHSPLLYDISAIVPKKKTIQVESVLGGRTIVREKTVIDGCKTGWDRVNNGLIKMYFGECLSKLPIMQHFLFGEFFGLVGLIDGTELMQHWQNILGDNNISEISIARKLKTSVDETGIENLDLNQNLDKEVVIKYVTGPSGNKIPIYGKLNVSHEAGCTRGTQTQSESQQSKLVDTFAMGQSFPTCCNMRVPSSIGANSARIPFD